MKKARLSLLELSVLASTRVALGVGVGLLLADTLHERERRTAGWGLFLLGAATTIPLARRVLHQTSEPLPPPPAEVEN